MFKPTKIQKEILNIRKFDHDLKNTFDPTIDIEKFKDLNNSSKLLKEYMDLNKHICIVSDSDADGITSAVVLYLSFKNIFRYENVSVLINNRKYGNGFTEYLTNEVLKIHKEKNIDLLLTSDHGSSDEKSFKILKTNGVGKIILTDHHTIPTDNYPKTADFVINHKRLDNNYNHDISGCFTAFLVMFETHKEIHNKYILKDFYQIIPFVGLSTMTDVMALDDDLNRNVVKLSVNIMNSRKYKMWDHLKKLLKISYRYTYKDLNFKIGPVINTTNRLYTTMTAFNYLISDDIDNLNVYGKELIKLNNYRKQLQKELLIHAVNNVGDTEHSAIVKLKTNYAINGIIAGMLVDKYKVPSVCFIDDDEKEFLTASARSTKDGISVYEILKEIDNRNNEILIKYGGHHGAAGCSIHKEKYLDFITLFDIIHNEMKNNIKHDYEKYDIELNSRLIDISLVNQLEALGPYGKNWEEVKIKSRFKIDRVMIFGNISKLLLKDTYGVVRHGMFFFNDNSGLNVENIRNRLRHGTNVEIIYNLHMSSFGNKVEISLTIQNIKEL